MKKILIAIICVLVVIAAAACTNQQTTTPDAQPTPTPQNDRTTDGKPKDAEKRYPYDGLKADALKEIEFFIGLGGYQSAPVTDSESFQKVAQYIREAKLIRDASGEGAGGNCGWGMRVELKDSIMGSNSFIVCYPNGEGNQLRIGPLGYEWIIESQDLADYIMNHLQNTYSSVTPEALPKAAANWFDSFGHEKGAYVYQHPLYTYVKINAGQKPSSGYGIRVVEFQNGLFEKRIVVEMVEPKPGEKANDVVTYPSVILQLQSESISTYAIETTKGERLKVESEAVEAVFETPRENAVIANPVLVKGKIAVFEGSFVVRIRNDHGKVIKEVNLQTSGAPSWGSFDTTIEYPDPETQKGSIELGWYTAKDGTYEPLEKINVRFQK